MLVGVDVAKVIALLNVLEPLNVSALPNVARVPFEPGNASVTLADCVKLVVNEPVVVKLPASANEPVPNVKLEPDPFVVNSVPLVGNVTLVLALTVSVVVNEPLVVKLPPSVIVLEPLFTPVPPYVAPTTLPCQVPVPIVPTLVKLELTTFDPNVFELRTDVPLIL